MDGKAADIDGDGQPDIILVKMHQATPPQEVAVYLSEGQGKTWRKQVLSTRGSHNLVVGDIGRTGTLDIVGANWSVDYQPIELWENLR